MGTLERMGNVLKSYFNDDGAGIFRRHGAGRSDPDLDAAYEELDDYLRNGGKKPADREEPARRQVPAELLKDFAELGLTPDATFEECKRNYKKLLKIHHPDKHTGHPDNIKKATEKSAGVNAAYRRLEAWFRRSV